MILPDVLTATYTRLTLRSFGAFWLQGRSLSRDPEATAITKSTQFHTKLKSMTRC